MKLVYQRFGQLGTLFMDNSLPHWTIWDYYVYRVRSRECFFGMGDLYAIDSCLLTVSWIFIVWRFFCCCSEFYVYVYCLVLEFFVLLYLWRL